MRLILAMVLFLAMATTVQAQAAPQFQLGFKALADQIPDVVGTPVDAEHYGPNGDSLQHTTKGLMAWRKLDNWTAYTNGATTWINGPLGVQSRPNDQRFSWETPFVPGIGDRIVKDGVAFTVNSASQANRINDIYNPASGKVFMIVDMTIEDLSQSSVDYGQVEVKLKDGDGYRYSPVMISAALDGWLQSGTLSQGQKARGRLAFEVPQGQSFTLSFAHLGLGTQAPIVVQLY